MTRRATVVAAAAFLDAFQKVADLATNSRAHKASRFPACVRIQPPSGSASANQITAHAGISEHTSISLSPPPCTATKPLGALKLTRQKPASLKARQDPSTPPMFHSIPARLSVHGLGVQRLRLETAGALEFLVRRGGANRRMWKVYFRAAVLRHLDHVPRGGDTWACPPRRRHLAMSPAEETPGHVPRGGDTWTMSPAEETPGHVPAEETPGHVPTEETPGHDPAEETPGHVPTEETPGHDPAEETPGPCRPRRRHLGMSPRRRHLGMTPRRRHLAMSPRRRHLGMSPAEETPGPCPRGGDTWACPPWRRHLAMSPRRTHLAMSPRR
ncbi:hypothetical protein CRUP_010592 [Coryphaenoides rupestris]|nr:hypothetical protein CRUP_010592 [Coryphaenoides rupestris]